MSAPAPTFREVKPLGATPIRELGLTIAGTPLEPVLAEFEAELRQAGVRRLRPRFYLSTEWGVPDGTLAIAIPFYLTRADLTALHAERVGHVEGTSRADILRYLRHEMGHVVNYAYRLYEQEEWVKLFGSIAQPYKEEYRPDAFSPRFVQHLPGWYAQKHPDEDWAETFAVWMTPNRDWRAEYAYAPVALAKLNYCDRTMTALADREPLTTAVDLDEDVGQLAYTPEDYYRSLDAGEKGKLPGLDGALRTIFDETPAGTKGRRPAAELVRRLELLLLANVYRWTGHFPERARLLLRHLAARAEQLSLTYPEDQESEATVALTTLVTALAMNHVRHGAYVPDFAHGEGR